MTSRRSGRSKNYTIRGTRGAKGGKSLYQQDLHAEALEGERVQQRLRFDFWRRLADGVHPRDADAPSALVGFAEWREAEAWAALPETATVVR